MLLSSGYSLIKSAEIIFKPYYFVKLFGSINSRKGFLQTILFSVVVFCLFFVIEGNFLCCTKIKVTTLFPNKAMNFSNDCN